MGSVFFRLVREESKKILGIHVGLLLAEVICVSAFFFELRRATGGNNLSWAYVFEWPILGLYGVYVWRKLLHEARHGVGVADTKNAFNQEEEASRDRYNDYLRRVHDAEGERDSPQD